MFKVTPGTRETALNPKGNPQSDGRHRHTGLLCQHLSYMRIYGRGAVCLPRAMRVPGASRMRKCTARPRRMGEYLPDGNRRGSQRQRMWDFLSRAKALRYGDTVNGLM